MASRQHSDGVLSLHGGVRTRVSASVGGNATTALALL